MGGLQVGQADRSWVWGQQFQLHVPGHQICDKGIYVGTKGIRECYNIMEILTLPRTCPTFNLMPLLKMHHCFNYLS